MSKSTNKLSLLIRLIGVNGFIVKEKIYSKLHKEAFDETWIKKMNRKLIYPEDGKLYDKYCKD